MRATKAAYVEWLNELGTPAEDKKSNGGRIPDHAQFGDWLRRNDPIAFEIGHREWAQEWEARS